MSSEAITRNDLTAILNEVLPPTPSEYRKLLWTNPSPTSDFVAQTISLDLSDYDAVDIEVNMYTSSSGEYHQTFRGAIGTNLLMSGMIYQTTMPLSRLCEIHSDSIPFNTGFANTDNNGAVVPLKIYGIKYERVNPSQLILPTIAYNESFVGSNNTIYKTHTVTSAGLYLILAKANANSGSSVPAIRIFVNDTRITQNADAGGSVMTYLATTLSAGDVVKVEFLATNSDSTSDWNNLTIIQLA